MDNVGEQKTFYDINSDQPILESSDIERLRIREDVPLDEMYKEYIRKKSQ